MGPRRETETVVGKAGHLELLIAVDHLVPPLTIEVQDPFSWLRDTEDMQRKVAVQGDEV
jgi:hypothetical protein